MSRNEPGVAIGLLEWIYTAASILDDARFSVGDGPLVIECDGYIELNREQAQSLRDWLTEHLDQIAD